MKIKKRGLLLNLSVVVAIFVFLSLAVYPAYADTGEAVSSFFNRLGQYILHPAETLNLFQRIRTEYTKGRADEGTCISSRCSDVYYQCWVDNIKYLVGYPTCQATGGDYSFDASCTKGTVPDKCIPPRLTETPTPIVTPTPSATPANTCISSRCSDVYYQCWVDNIKYLVGYPTCQATGGDYSFDATCTKGTVKDKCIPSPTPTVSITPPPSRTSTPTPSSTSWPKTTALPPISYKSLSDLNNQVVDILNEKPAKGPLSPESSDRLADLIAKRKDILLGLAKSNPQAFLDGVLSAEYRTKLPSDLQDDVESRVSSQTAELQVWHRDLPNQTAEFLYFLSINGGRERWQFYPAEQGALEGLISGTKVKVTGYRLDNGSREDVFVGETDRQNFQILTIPQATAGETTGDQKVLAILVNFQDSDKAPFTKTEAEEILFRGPFQNFYKEASFKKMFWSGKVVGWYTLPRKGHVDGFCEWPYLSSLSGFDDLYRAVKKDVDVFEYPRIVILANHECMGGGFSTVGRLTSILDGKSFLHSQSSIGGLAYYSNDSGWGRQPFKWRTIDYLLSHELGHALGVFHANSWDCGEDTLYGSCNHGEYGNYFDVMGNGSNSLHLNAYFKEFLHWLDPGSVLKITKSGRYTLKSYETDKGHIAKIQPAGFNDAPFYLEYRQPIGFDTNLEKSNLVSNTKGLMVNWINYTDYVYDAVGNARLLDMTPTETDYWEQVTLNEKGGTFEDSGRGISIGPVVKADLSEITFDVKISDPKCIRTNPRIKWFYPSYQKVKTGEEWNISMTLVNLDSDACPAPTTSDFKINTTMPTGWSLPSVKIETTTTKDNFSVYLKGRVPTNAKAGYNSISVSATNTKSAKTSLIENADFEVEKDGLQIEPISGQVGTSVIISGFDFGYTANKVNFDFGEFANIESKNGRSIRFEIPEFITPPCTSYRYKCLAPARRVEPGTYEITVANSKGVISDVLKFEVISGPEITHIFATKSPSVLSASPSNLRASCDRNALKATLSWNKSAGAVRYALRVNDPSNDGPNCVDKWFCSDPPDKIVDNLSQTSYVLNVIPDKKYGWWVHSFDQKGGGGVAGDSFTCVKMSLIESFLRSAANLLRVILPGN